MAPREPPTSLDWRAGWISDPVQHASPRYTMRGPGNKQGQWRRRIIRPKLHQAKEPETHARDTCFDQLIRLESWKPGPGTYRTNVEFHTGAKDEYRGGNTEKFDGPNYTVPKIVRTTSSPNFNREYLPSSFRTPGPGYYKQMTTFGQPSGPSRSSYFGTVETRWAGKTS